MQVETDFDVLSRPKANYYRTHPDLFPAHPVPAGIGSLALGESLVIETTEAAVPPSVADTSDWAMAEPVPEFQFLTPAFNNKGSADATQ
jgi:hypothetical protein